MTSDDYSDLPPTIDTIDLSQPTVALLVDKVRSSSEHPLSPETLALIEKPLHDLQNALFLALDQKYALTHDLKECVA